MSRKKARLDADRTAKPIAKIVGHFKQGDCVGPASCPENYEFRDDTGKTAEQHYESLMEDRDALHAHFDRRPIPNIAQLDEMDLVYHEAFLSGEDHRAAQREATFFEMDRERFLEKRVNDKDPEMAAMAYSALTHLRVLRSGRASNPEACADRFAILYAELTNKWNLATDLAINFILLGTKSRG